MTNPAVQKLINVGKKLTEKSNMKAYLERIKQLSKPEQRYVLEKVKNASAEAFMQSKMRDNKYVRTWEKLSNAMLETNYTYRNTNHTSSGGKRKTRKSKKSSRKTRRVRRH